MRKCIALLALAGTAGSTLAGGTVIGRDISTDSSIFLSRSSNLGSTFTNGNLDTFGPGDSFGIMFRGIAVGAGVPFDLLDDSVSVFTGDLIGIVGETDFDPFFGVVDVDNANNPNGNLGTATWAFDITGFTGLEFAADFAAMGDFESSDTHLFEYQIDGGGWVTLLSSTVDEAGSQNYVLDSGTNNLLNDPMLLNGTLLNNDFQNISAAIAGSGSTLEIRYSSTQNAGSEAFAFRNLEITGVPAPGSLALLGLGGLAAARRRRA